MSTNANRHLMNSTVIDMTKPAFGSSRSILRTIAPGFAWAGLSVAILSGWFVVTRVGFRQALNVWDVTALRFGEGAILLTPRLLLLLNRKHHSRQREKAHDPFLFPSNT